MSAICSSETSIVFQRTTRRYIPEKNLITAVRSSYSAGLHLSVIISVITEFLKAFKKRFAIWHIFKITDSCIDGGKYLNVKSHS
jgi:hypothetical protein